MLTHSPCIWFGPVSTVPSWHWVGADVAERMKRWLPVRYFEDITELPDKALVFWIKRPGNNRAARAVRQKKLRVVFFPVDCFSDSENIAEHRAFIDSARLVSLHARSLAPYFPKAELAYVDHYNKYGVKHQDRMPGNRYLWVGAFQYVPYVLQAIEHFRSIGNVLLLSDQDRPNAWAAAKVNAARIGVDHFEKHLVKPGVELVTWSEESQRAALLTCRAAFDAKYEGCFNQRHKPPTKMQKYLCSGIPCAINERVALREQLAHEVANLSQLTDNAGNAEYLRRLALYSVELSSELSLDNVANSYLRLAKLLSPEVAHLEEPAMLPSQIYESRLSA